MNETQKIEKPEVTAKTEDEIIKNMSYEQISKSVSEETPTVTNAKILTGWSVSSAAMTPQQLIDKIKNNHILVLRRCWWSELPRILLLVISVILWLWLSIQYLAMIPFIFLPLALMPLTVLAALLHRRYNRKYVFNADSILVIHGLLGIKTTRVSSKILLIKGVEVKKTLIQRILGVGDILLSTVMFDQPELSLAGLANPHFYATVVRLLQEDLKAHHLSKSNTETNI